MSLFNSFDLDKLFSELNSPRATNKGMLTSAQQKATARSNLGISGSGSTQTDLQAGVSGARFSSPILVQQGTPTAANATATLTAVQLSAGIITSTTAAAVVLTLPTAASWDSTIIAVWPGMQNTDSFDFSLINTGPSDLTLALGTGWTNGGNALAAVTTGTSARFKAVRTSSSAWVVYKIA